MGDVGVGGGVGWAGGGALESSVMNTMRWHQLRGALCQGCRWKPKEERGHSGGGGLSTESLEAEGAWSEGSGGRGLGGQVATAGLPAERELPMSGTFVS